MGFHVQPGISLDWQGAVVVAAVSGAPWRSITGMAHSHGKCWHRLFVLLCLLVLQLAPCKTCEPDFVVGQCSRTVLALFACCTSSCLIVFMSQMGGGGQYWLQEVQLRAGVGCKVVPLGGSKTRADSCTAVFLQDIFCGLNSALHLL